jgi:hypothetical protein
LSLQVGMVKIKPVWIMAVGGVCHANPLLLMAGVGGRLLRLSSPTPRGRPEGAGLVVLPVGEGGPYHRAHVLLCPRYRPRLAGWLR